MLAITEFDFGTLTLSSLKLLGDVHLNNGSVRLTRDLAVPNFGAGRVLYSKPVRFKQPSTPFPASFSTFFTFSVNNLNPSSICGGLAFIISPNDEVVGDADGFLGLQSVEDPGSGSGSSFVAVEFDTLMDVEFKDINSNHVGLDLNSMVSSQVSDLGATDIDLKSGDLVNCWIEFSGSICGEGERARKAEKINKKEREIKKRQRKKYKKGSWGRIVILDLFWTCCVRIRENKDYPV
ncbi:putative non-specific serine/threonine protein kinase [Rosa chinensis]|uniref:Putative non-specific serine/threonine protein kinase n=1 Tax=Rosa chinensis TaxID=74649 RepID=A0A2P6RBF0_ROSCH|nr:putative non-specific serine/threonine protein kinase [Rosa chinensis]